MKYKKRSVIDITEVFDGTATEYTTVDFILGLRLPAAFQIPNVVMYRRPKCTLANSAVESCDYRQVKMSRGWVLNRDVIFAIPTRYSRPYLCSLPGGTNCPYIGVSTPTTYYSICYPSSTDNDSYFKISKYD